MHTVNCFNSYTLGIFLKGTVPRDFVPPVDVKLKKVASLVVLSFLYKFSFVNYNFVKNVVAMIDFLFSEPGNIVPIFFDNIHSRCP